MLMLLERHTNRKPQPRGISRPVNRRHFLSTLRDEIAVMRAIGLEHDRIAVLLDIDERDVRIFCPKTGKTVMRRDLTRQAVNALLHGRHAHVGGRTISNRAKRLADIAAAYTKDELLAEPGIGAVKATEIELWLEARGLRLRKSDQSAPSGECARDRHTRNTDKVPATSSRPVFIR